MKSSPAGFFKKPNLDIYLKTFALYPGLPEPVGKKILPKPLKIIINIRYHSSLQFNDSGSFLTGPENSS